MQSDDARRGASADGLLLNRPGGQGFDPDVLGIHAVLNEPTIKTQARHVEAHLLQRSFAYDYGCGLDCRCHARPPFPVAR